MSLCTLALYGPWRVKREESWGDTSRPRRPPSASGHSRAEQAPVIPRAKTCSDFRDRLPFVRDVLRRHRSWCSQRPLMRRGAKWTALACSWPSMASIAPRASSRKKRCSMIVAVMIPVRHATDSPHNDRVMHVVVTSTVSWSAFARHVRWPARVRCGSMVMC